MTHNPKNQHDVPSTYLRKFACNSKFNESEKMVNVLLIHRKKKIVEKSAAGNFFKTENFYTIRGKDKFSVEKIFSAKIEPWYHEIVKEIKSETNLNDDIRAKLVSWLWFSKIRNTHQRKIIEQQIEFYTSIQQKSNNGENTLNKLNALKSEIISGLAKDFHMDFIFDKKAFASFDKGIITKHWLILKSSGSQKFITNDNPGFSVTFEKGNPILETLNSQFATVVHATNYYPLTPDYCLMISPFYKGTPAEINLYNKMNIKYISASEKHIIFINFASYQLMRKYCVSNDKSHLEPFLEIDLPQQIDFSNIPVFPVGGVLVREGEEYLTGKNRI